MRLTPIQLSEHLQRKKFASLYLIAGDEPFQIRECIDMIRDFTRAHGFTERMTFTVETGFDWQMLAQETQSLSLFAYKRLLELHLGDKNPDKAGIAVLIDYATHPPPDMVLLITKNKLDNKSKWLNELEKHCVITQVRPIELSQLTPWIAQRMKQQGLKPSAEAIQVLADRSEGHLLACAQEIEKLRLLYGAGPINATQVLEAVADSARFELFDWVDTVFTGDAKRSMRQLQQLQAEGYEPVLITWALTREIRLLYQLSYAVTTGQSQEQAFKTYRVWQNRKKILSSALNRHPLTRWQQFLQRAIQLDKISKGMAQGRAWDELLRLSLQVAHSKFSKVFS